VDEETRPIPILFVHLPSEEHIETKIQAEIVAQIAAVTLAKPRQYVVGAVIEREGNILCCRRGKGENMAGYWEFPGGKIKEGESKKEALSREIEEELSMKISLHDSIQTVEHHELNRVIQITFLRATIDVGEPILSVHDEYRWLPRDQLSELEWLAADSSIIELLKN
jgi:8-oxo-dGTP diphosphatase